MRCIILLVVTLLACHPEVTEWEHGWKTEDVTATRYESPVMGYNIGFKFTSHPESADRIELVEFIEAHDGWVYSGGGHFGAEMFVVFKDITDRPSADRKLPELLVPLSALVRSL